MNTVNATTSVASFPDSVALSQALARAIGCAHRPIDVHHFPDGESRVRVPPSPTERVIIVRSLDRPNTKLLELLLATQTFRELGTRNIELVCPYLCYMRQDKRFHPGEAISQPIVGNMLASIVDGLVTVDPHLHRTPALEGAVPAARTQALSAVAPIAAFLHEQSVDYVLVGPDSESRQWVQGLANLTKMSYHVGRKVRSGDHSVVVSFDPRQLRGRKVLLIDDIASTGRTLAAACEAAKRCGATEVDAIITHALFADGAMEAIIESGVGKLWSTNSIAHETNAVDLTAILAAAVAPSFC